MQKHRKQRDGSRFHRKHFGRNIAAVLVVLVLVVCLPQIMRGLGLSATDEKSLAKTAHYDNLEIPAAFADGRPDLRRSYIGYTVSYNSGWRLPNWSAYELVREELDGRAPRKDDFRPDETLHLPQAEKSDYTRSGFDRGHMTPAGDMRWDRNAMSESFYFTNICPQAPAVNRGDWKRLEIKIREWAEQDSALVIVCGPIVSPTDATIGRNRVKVPSAFYKVVVAPYVGAGKGIGFIFPNRPKSRRQPLARYAVSIDSVEVLTGIDFFPVLPDEIENRIESRYDLDEWNF